MLEYSGDVAYVGHPVSRAPTGDVVFASYTADTAMPAGLSFSTTTGLLSGTPAATANLQIGVSGANNDGYPADLLYLSHANADGTSHTAPRKMTRISRYKQSTDIARPGNTKSLFPLRSVPVNNNILGDSSLMFSNWDVGECFSAEGWVLFTNAEALNNVGIWGATWVSAYNYISFSMDTFLFSHTGTPWITRTSPLIGFGWGSSTSQLIHAFTGARKTVDTWYHRGMTLTKFDETHWDLRVYDDGVNVAYARLVADVTKLDLLSIGSGGGGQTYNMPYWDHFAQHFPRDVSSEWADGGRRQRVILGNGETGSTTLALVVLPQPTITIPAALVLFIGQHSTVSPALNYDASDATGLFDVVDQPAGLLVNPDTGIVEGLPTTVGTHTMKVRMSPGLPGMSLMVESGTCTTEVRPVPTAAYQPPFRLEPNDAVSLSPDAATSMSGCTWVAEGQVPVWLSVDALTGQVTGTIPSDAPQQTVGFTVRASAIPDWTGPDVLRAISFHVAPEGTLAYDAIIMNPEDTDRAIAFPPQTPLDTTDELVWFSVEPPLPPGLALDPSTGMITTAFDVGDLMFTDVDGQYEIIMHSPYHAEDDPQLRTSLFVSVQAVVTVCNEMVVSFPVVEVPVGEPIQMVPAISTSGLSNRPWKFFVGPNATVSIDELTGVVSGTLVTPTVPGSALTVTASCGSSAVQFVTMAFTAYERFEYPPESGSIRLGQEFVYSHSMGGSYTNFSIEPNLLPTGMRLDTINGAVYGTPTTWLGESDELHYTVRCFRDPDGTLAKGTLTLRLSRETDSDDGADDGAVTASASASPATKEDTEMGALGYTGIAFMVIGVIALSVLLVKKLRSPKE